MTEGYLAGVLVGMKHSFREHRCHLCEMRWRDLRLELAVKLSKTKGGLHEDLRRIPAEPAQG